MRKITRFISVLLIICLITELIPGAVFAADDGMPFRDVRESDWFFEAVQYVYEKGMMRGTGDTTFSPESTTTRAMIVTILHRLEGLPAAVGEQYADVPSGQYYTDAVAWASDNGIVNGYGNGKFGPNDAITREQMATILYRFAQFKAYDVSDINDLSAFSDGSSVHDWARAAMSWANAVGLIMGVGNNRLNPTGNALRSQAAAILMRFQENVALQQSQVDPDPTSYTVRFDLQLNGMKNPEDQIVALYEYAVQPRVPEREGYEFIGWYLDKNESDLKNCFVFGETPITGDITLYARWINVSIDTDGDGLSDELEDYVGTDKTKVDTDDDGLTDYQEVVEVGTDPLKMDSDGNGIADFNEDYDGDGILNGEEFIYGTNPIYEDTDLDDLSDFEEIHSDTYQTDPLLDDTDGDGALDGWEIRNGFDPTAFNSSFSVSIEAAAATEIMPVTAGTTATLDGEIVTSLNIRRVSSADNAFLTPFIAGYLGQAYDFTSNGPIESAIVTFCFDESLGTLGEDFQPRIYRFNEEDATLEELEDQTIIPGQVSAEVQQFGPYILLNKVEYDAVWDVEIIPPLPEDADDEAALAELLEDTRAETIDITTDSNNDGIPDYYNDLIYKGDLRLSNSSFQFKGFDFNVSDDWDEDGLKNGEELHVVQKNGDVYLTMTSNPVLKHSDNDGISDYDEVKNGSNPLKYQYRKKAVNNLVDDAQYSYSRFVKENYDNDNGEQVITYIGAVIFGVLDIVDLYEDIMIDYFTNYKEATDNERLKCKEEQITAIETLDNVASIINKNGGDAKDVYELVSEISGTSDPDDLDYLLTHSFNDTIDEIFTLYPETSLIPVSSYSMNKKTIDLINQYSSIAGKVCKGLTIALELYTDFAEPIKEIAIINTYEEAFDDNIDILRKIREESTDIHAAHAADSIMCHLAEEYSNKIMDKVGAAAEEIGVNVFETAAHLLVGLLASSNVYVLAVLTIREIIEIITGISRNTKLEYETITYARMTTVVISLLNNTGYTSGSYYYVLEDNIKRFERLAANLAQLRILGEKKYGEYMLMKNYLFGSSEEVASFVGITIKNVSGAVDDLNLKISSDLYEPWEPFAYTIAFDGNGADHFSELNMQPIRRIYGSGEPIILPECRFTREGYAFGWWFDYNDNIYYDKATIDHELIYPSIERLTDPHTTFSEVSELSDAYTILFPTTVFLRAYWIEKYVIRYHGNGEDKNISIPMPDQEVIDLGLTPLNPNSFNKNGFLFTGWNTREDGRGHHYEDDEEVNLSGDLDLYAEWAEAAVIRYHFNGEAGAINEENLTVDVEVIKGTSTYLDENIFDRTGYRFIGWNTRPDGKGHPYYAGDSNEVYMSEDLDLYAQWEQVKSVVVIRYNGNHADTDAYSNMPDQVIYIDPSNPYQSTELNPNRFHKNGYHFNGWNTRDDGKGYHYRDGEPVNPNDLPPVLNLYAEWVPNEVTITFHPNGGSPNQSFERTYAYGADVELEELFKYGDYPFVGWCENSDGSGEIIKVKTIKAYENRDLYAIWSKPATILFDGNGGKTDSGNTMYTQPIKTFIDINLYENQFHNPGYRFDGWTTNRNGPGETYENLENVNLKGNLTLYAKWTYVGYRTIRFAGNGYPNLTGSMDDITVLYDDLVTLPENKFAYLGYKFVCWSTTYSTSDGKDFNDQGSFRPTENVTLYAQWNYVGTSTIKFVGDIYGQATGSMDELVVTNGEKFNLPENKFELPGYRFVNWSTSYDGAGGKSIKDTGEYTPDGDVTLYAQWAPAEECTIHFVGSIYQDDDLSGSMSDFKATIGEETPLPENEYVRLGYKFTGWSTSYNGSGGITIRDQGKFTPDGDVTLYAQWTYVGITTIHFVGSIYLDDGVSGSMPELKVTTGETITLPKNEFTRPGYRFVCWNTSYDDAGNDVQDQGNYIANEDVTLYAQWTEHDEIHSCGENLTWSFDESTGVLTISGSGEMTNWDDYNHAPWHKYSSDIKTVLLPEGLRSIGDLAFTNCIYLEDIHIPDSVIRIGYGAFWDCRRMREITIPGSVKSIGERLFYFCIGLRNVTISVGVTTIPDLMFEGCRYLAKVTIPEGVTNIGNGAFIACYSLTSIMIPNSVTSFGEYAFSDCTKLESFIIPEGVTRIPAGMFSGCSTLKEVTIPDSVTSIGKDAFKGCKNLPENMFPDSN